MPKRAAAFAAFLKDEILENVGHTLFTFTLPKMLRVYFMHHRELLSDLARLAYETIHSDGPDTDFTAKLVDVYPPSRLSVRRGPERR